MYFCFPSEPDDGEGRSEKGRGLSSNLPLTVCKKQTDDTADFKLESPKSSRNRISSATEPLE